MGKKFIEDSDDKKGKKVTYNDVKPKNGDQYDRTEYLALLEIYHVLRPYLEKKPKVTKEELLIRFPKHKKMVNEVWECINDLKLVWSHEIANRILN